MIPAETRLLFLDEPGSALTLESDHCLLTPPQSAAPPLKLPFSSLSGIVVQGAASISSPFILKCAEHNIPISFLDYSGRISSCLHSFLHHSSSVRKSQFFFELLPQAPLLAAKSFALDKISMQRRLLRNIRSNHPSPVLAEFIHRLSSAIRHGKAAASIPELRGVEGAAASAYWSAWTAFLPSFHGRQKHPPLDPVNAMLSFGYAVLSHELAALAVSRGLDLNLSVLHASSDRYPSLVWDLIEPCRPWFVDRIVFSGFRRRRYLFSEFSTLPDGSVRLLPPVKKKFLSDFFSAASGPNPVPFSRKPLLAVIDNYISFLERSVSAHA